METYRTGLEDRRNRALLMHPRDNVAVVLQDTFAGDVLTVVQELAEGGQAGGVEELRAVRDMPLGFKVARVPLNAGDLVYRAGSLIGRATVRIAPGDRVHVENLESTLQQP